MSLEKHPVQTLKNLINNTFTAQYWDQGTFEVKVYQRPNVESDQDPENRPGHYERKTVMVPANFIRDMQEMHELLAHVGAHSGEDLSIGNRVVFAHEDVACFRFRYIQQVDFKVRPSAVVYTKADEGKKEVMIPRHMWTEIVEQMGVSTDIAIYFSGRSFHGYALDIMNHEQWTKYMGRLLLLNNPTRADIVDSRWIGRSLAVGQSYLRLTAESTGYLQVPEFQHKL
jgi:hypothetical protein